MLCKRRAAIDWTLIVRVSGALYCFSIYPGTTVGLVHFNFEWHWCTSLWLWPTTSICIISVPNVDDKMNGGKDDSRKKCCVPLSFFAALRRPGTLTSVLKKNAVVKNKKNEAKRFRIEVIKINY